MDRDRKIFLGIILLLLISMIVIGIVVFRDKQEEQSRNGGNAEGLIFKNEYETLNNVVRAKDGRTIKEITINANNPVDIISEEEAVSLLESGTGILYFGFPDCPWCRSMLPVLLQTLDNMSIDKLYYLNISNIRDTLSLGEKNKVEVAEEGTPGYYKIIKLMDRVLEPYYLTNEEGKKIDTKEKRLMAPTVVGIKNGQITSIHVGTVESQESGYDDLSTEQQEELANIFMELVRTVYEVDCDEAC